MQSVRSRMGSLLRRSSVIGDKDDQSGSERESSVPPSPRGSLRRLTGEGKRRKRLSFSMRGRSGTADTLEHSQLAKKVANAIEVESADKPVATVLDSSNDAAPAYTASDNVVGTSDALKLTSLHDKKEEVAAPEEQAAVSTDVPPVEVQEAQQLPTELPPTTQPDEAPAAAPAEEKPSEDPKNVEVREVQEVQEAAHATDASNTESNVK